MVDLPNLGVQFINILLSCVHGLIGVRDLLQHKSAQHKDVLLTFKRYLCHLWADLGSHIQALAGLIEGRFASGFITPTW